MIGAVLFGFFASSCKTFFAGDERPAYGLTRVQLDITHESMAKMNTTVSSKAPVSAYVKIGEERFAVHVHYSGASTIDDFKKSLHVTFKNGQKYRKRSHLRLSAQSTDPSAIRSLLGYKVYEWAKAPTSFLVPIALYINSNYAGLYYAIEPVDEEFFLTRNREVAAIYKTKGNTEVLASASITSLEQNFSVAIKPKSYWHLEQLVRVANARKSDDNQRELRQLVDIEAYLRYVAASVYLKNWDGYNNNVYLVRGQDGRFFPVPWDVDKVFEVDSDRETFKAGVSIYGRNELTKKILSYPNWKREYLRILEEFIASHPIADILRLTKDFKNTVNEAADHDRVFHAMGLSRHQKELESEIQAWITSIAEDVKSEIRLK